MAGPHLWMASERASGESGAVAKLRKLYQNVTVLSSVTRQVLLLSVCLCDMLGAYLLIHFHGPIPQEVSA